MVVDRAPRPAWEPGQRFERIARVFIPAWSIRSSVDLLADERFGADAANEMLQTATGVTGLADARQEAVASFDRYGFQAAAVTFTASPRAGIDQRPRWGSSASPSYVLIIRSPRSPSDRGLDWPGPRGGLAFRCSRHG